MKKFMRQVLHDLKDGSLKRERASTFIESDDDQEDIRDDGTDYKHQLNFVRRSKVNHKRAGSYISDLSEPSTPEGFPFSYQTRKLSRFTKDSFKKNGKLKKA